MYLFKNETKELKGLGNKGKIETTAYLSRTNSELISVINDLIEEKEFFKTVRKPYEIFGLALNVLKLSKKEELDKSFKYLSKMISDENNILEQLNQIAEETDDIELKTAVKIEIASSVTFCLAVCIIFTPIILINVFLYNSYINGVILLNLKKYEKSALYYLTFFLK